MTLTFGSLFAGIGGIDLGFERAGMRCVWQCEIDPYCNRVLAKHWPDVPRYTDVRQLGLEQPVERPNVLVGGFPCQPFSAAGKKLGADDPRHLWPEFARLVGDLRPEYVVGENVRGLCKQGLDEVLGDLARLGYDAEWQLVSAASVGAPHIRERVFIVAYPQGERERPGLREDEPAEGGGRRLGDEGCSSRAGSLARGSGAHVADASGAGLEVGPSLDRGADESGRPAIERAGVRSRIYTRPPAAGWAPEPAVGRMAYGVPGAVDRLRALGNAVVPQVAEYVGRLIVEDAAR